MRCLKSLVLMLSVLVSASAFADSVSVAACGMMGYQTEDDLKACLASGADAELIFACGLVGYKNAAGINHCLVMGATSDLLGACARKVGADNADQVDACVAAELATKK